MTNPPRSRRNNAATVYPIEAVRLDADLLHDSDDNSPDCGDCGNTGGRCPQHARRCYVCGARLGHCRCE